LILNNLSIAELNISNNHLIANTIAASINPISPNLTAQIDNNTFNYSTTNGLRINISTGTNTLSIQNNGYTGVPLPVSGYAAAISNTGGTICLDFSQNSTTPTSIPVNSTAYAFSNTAGTFNLTPATNTGTFTFTGSFGNCSQ
jgi:hypothetical protein